jgi:hypothetical protein
MTHDEMEAMAKSYEIMVEKYHEILDSHHHLEWELDQMRQKRDCMAVEKCVRGERIAALEAAIKQILWKLTRTEMHPSGYCVPASIKINDACLNEAKALINERMT